jgi:hypothetical protein
MRRLGILIILIVAGVLILGYYREWFTFSTSGTDQSTDINMKVDRGKLKADEEKAKEKLGELGEKIRDQSKTILKKNQPEADDKNQPDKPR